MPDWKLPRGRVYLVRAKPGGTLLVNECGMEDEDMRDKQSFMFAATSWTPAPIPWF